MSRSLVTREDPCAAAASPPTTTKRTLFSMSPPSIEAKLTCPSFASLERSAHLPRALPVARLEFVRAPPARAPDRRHTSALRLLRCGAFRGVMDALCALASRARVLGIDSPGRWIHSGRDRSGERPTASDRRLR